MACSSALSFRCVTPALLASRRSYASGSLRRRPDLAICCAALTGDPGVPAPHRGRTDRRRRRHRAWSIVPGIVQALILEAIHRMPGHACLDRYH